MRTIIANSASTNMLVMYLYWELLILLIAVTAINKIEIPDRIINKSLSPDGSGYNKNLHITHIKMYMDSYSKNHLLNFGSQRCGVCIITITPVLWLYCN